MPSENPPWFVEREGQMEGSSRRSETATHSSRNPRISPEIFRLRIDLFQHSTDVDQPFTDDVNYDAAKSVRHSGYSSGSPTNHMAIVAITLRRDEPGLSCVNVARPVGWAFNSSADAV